VSKSDPSEDVEMREEHGLSKGVRGKHAECFRQGSNLAVLYSDVAAEFPTRESVNKAVRVYLARKKTGEGAA
jgi:hypothetical protein